MAEANATVTVVYELETDSDGQVQRVRKLRNEMLPDDALIACFKRWKLPAANAKVSVSQLGCPVTRIAVSR